MADLADLRWRLRNTPTRVLRGLLARLVAEPWRPLPLPDEWPGLTVAELRVMTEDELMMRGEG